MKPTYYNKREKKEKRTRAPVEAPYVTDVPLATPIYLMNPRPTPKPTRDGKKKKKKSMKSKSKQTKNKGGGKKSKASVKEEEETTGKKTKSVKTKSYTAPKKKIRHMAKGTKHSEKQGEKTKRPITSNDEEETRRKKKNKTTSPGPKQKKKKKKVKKMGEDYMKIQKGNYRDSNDIRR